MAEITTPDTTELLLLRSGDVESNPGPKRKHLQVDTTSETVNDFDDILKKVAREVKKHVEIDDLGKALGFQPLDIQRYIQTNQRSHLVTSDGTLQMLRDWRKKQNSRDELPSLREALQNAGLLRLADTFLPLNERRLVNTPSETVNDFDDILKKIAREVKKHMEIDDLGKALRFQPEDIELYIHINQHNHLATSYGTLQMLRDWRKKQYSRDEVPLLRQALQNAGLLRLTDTFLLLNKFDTISEDQLKEKVPCNRSRIMVVGPAGVGKTSFINRLTNQSFDQEEESTVGTVNTHTTSQWKVEKGPRDELVECLARHRNTFSGERKAVQTNSDLSRPTTERVSSQGVQDEASVDHTSSETEGNDKLKEYAKGISPERIHSVKSSANDIIYSIWDFGGQEIYYITHPLFLSWRSLYIAVFPLHKIMTENALREEGQMEGCPTRTYRTMLDLMHFWMMSIYVHAVPPDGMEDPKILLVGTFCNDDQSKSNKEMSISKLQNMVTGKPYSSQVILSVEEVDNKSSSDDEISQFQRKIDDLIKDADYMKKELPIKWRIFLDKTKDLHQDTLKLTEARKIMDEIGICDDKEVQDVLKFCHDAGHLIYHQGCELIILHPEVLNSFVSNIITVITPEKLHGELGEHWDRLQKKGVLSMDLIKAVWKQHKGKDDELDMVIDMMINFDLMCEIQDTQGAYQGRHFFVPCRSSPTLHLEEQHGRDDEFQFIIDFKYLLPDGFLHRLYVRLAKWAMDEGGPEDPSFHCREMLFYIDERHRVIMSNDIEGGNAHKIKVTIYAISAGDHPDPNAKVNFQCPFMKYLDDTLDELKKTWARRITYAVGIECQECHKTVPLAKFRRYKERAPCGNCGSSLLVSRVPQCIRQSSVDAKTTGSAGLLGDARRRTVESAQRSVDPPHQPSNSSASASSHGQQAFYDIYLVYNEDTEHVRNVKAIIHRNGWKMTTPADSRLGVPKMDSIEEALKTCSHLILVITEEDCRKNDPDQTMTINMAFHSSEKSFGSRVIPIRCCDEKHLPQKLKSLTNACVIDANLEDRLKKSINVSIRKRREGTSAGSDDSSQSSASSN